MGFFMMIATKAADFIWSEDAELECDEGTDDNARDQVFDPLADEFIRRLASSSMLLFTDSKNAFNKAGLVKACADDGAEVTGIASKSIAVVLNEETLKEFDHDQVLLDRTILEIRDIAFGLYGEDVFVLVYYDRGNTRLRPNHFLGLSAKPGHIELKKMINRISTILTQDGANGPPHVVVEMKKEPSTIKAKKADIFSSLTLAVAGVIGFALIVVPFVSSLIWFTNTPSVEFLSLLSLFGVALIGLVKMRLGLAIF